MSKVLVDREMLEQCVELLDLLPESRTVVSMRELLAQPAEAEGASALDDLLALFPLKIDKQAFVVNYGSPLTADGDDEFLSFKKVDAALGEIRQLAEHGRAALSAVTAERDAANYRLHEVAVACAEAEAARDQLRAEVEALRKAGRLVLDGLNARIDEASANDRPVPVFDGIAELHAAMAAKEV